MVFTSFRHDYFALADAARRQVCCEMPVPFATMRSILGPMTTRRLVALSQCALAQYVDDVFGQPNSKLEKCSVAKAVATARSNQAAD